MTDLSPETVGKLVAFVRKAAAHVSPMAQYSAVRDHLGDEARAIVADLPEPVDPDLVEAREACAIHAQRINDYGLADEYRSGALDQQFEMQAALVAIRGRALAAGDRS